MVAERQGDLFGLITFNDRVRSFVRAKSGKPHFNACREVLYTLQPELLTPDYTELFTFISTRLRRRVLLLFLTNLDDPVLAESFARDIHLISRRHLVLVNMIRPAGVGPMFTLPEPFSTDEVYEHLGGHILWTGLRETESVLRKSGVSFSLVDNEKMCLDLVSQYLSVKLRQAL